ncbi:WD40-repeat-containing domain protein [Dimargaris cristalligena]|uniref:WD40-repeat-containing domain protein n=1 Tax=Dimargaris cristalligena TaxID=215637 RepID=A0A4Q0A1R0_9FUNG|nr:WD40-repeat-containing domain protein [Dimargaris cristalligena]|eukprot:RKP39401.1 WD40-repeat-containing domain protein [Dimargaris cristalligena]
MSRSPSSSQHSSSSSEVSDYESDTGEAGPPTTQFVELSDHRKTVGALALDPAGARLISGGHDYTIKLWDFAGMDAAFRPFRTIEPFGECPIHDIHYSLTGDRFLAVADSPSPMLFDRDGDTLEQFAKGDMYIRDQRRTAGHTMAITRVGWHPTNTNTFYTASRDGTVRIWDATQKHKQNQVLVIRPQRSTTRVSVEAALMPTNGQSIITATNDGCLSMWSTKGNPNKPTHCVAQAHAPGGSAESLALSRDQNILASRSGDDTVKLWDLRQFKLPLATRTNLPCLYSGTGLLFSPDERYIIRMLNRADLSDAYNTPIEGTSVISVLWHSRINQIICSTNKGAIRVYYDPSTSVRGAKLGVERAAKPQSRSSEASTILPHQIITPHALPMYRNTGPVGSKKRQLEKLRQDPVASRMPERPMAGHGHSGRLGHTETQHIMKSLIKNTALDEDPREALLKYAKAAEEDPYWVTPAYQKTHPRPGKRSDEGTDDNAKRKRPNPS